MKHPALVSSLLVTPQALSADPALQGGRQGIRRLVVTDLYPTTEHEATEPTWAHAGAEGYVPVIVADGLEVACFNQDTVQDRHYHAVGTEIYTVIEGVMLIWVNSVIYPVGTGATIIINPGTVHEVLRETQFRCMVYTHNSHGVSDKFIAE